MVDGGRQATGDGAFDGSFNLETFLDDAGLQLQNRLSAGRTRWAESVGPNNTSASWLTAVKSIFRAVFIFATTESTR